MPNLREEIDADYTTGRRPFTEFRTEQNPHEITCSSCGGRVFADDAGYDHVTRALEHDPDNQFVCDQCIEDADEEHLAH